MELYLLLKIRLPAGLAKAIEVSASRDRQLDWDQRTRPKLIGWMREREEKHWLHRSPRDRGLGDAQFETLRQWNDAVDVQIVTGPAWVRTWRSSYRDLVSAPPPYC